jgi:hypothetical protein
MQASPILILAMLTTPFSSWSAAQQPQPQAYTLVLRSADLPEKDRQSILASIDVSTCPALVVSEIVAQKARGLGCLQAAVEEQKQESGDRIQLTEDIRAGIRYRLREINFENATVFTPDQLRKVIPLNPGDVASGSGIINGLEGMRELYASKGYINAVMIPIPSFDSRQGLVDFTFDVDEGTPSQFGELLLNGVEPYPGAAKQLIASWQPLRGQLFNPSVLDKWLQTNKTGFASSKDRNLAYKERNISSSSHLVDITLKLPPNPLQ